MLSFEENIRQIHMDNIKFIFVLATIFLLIALIQKVKPTFSLTYQINSKPSYVKAKFLSKLVTSVTLYICGLYLYYFIDLTETSSWYFFSALWIPIFLYHIYKWGFMKILDFRAINKINS